MIFYFSGTGNTEWAARYIAEQIGERLIDMAKEVNGECLYTLNDNERIGFCFPVHGWQPPNIVKRFVGKLAFENAGHNYCYALCTCGDSVGHTMKMLKKRLSGCGLELHSSFSLIMPESYVCLPFMYTDTEEREADKIAMAKTDIADYADIIKNRVKGVERLVKGVAPLLFSYVIGAYFNKMMITDKPFAVDTDKCMGCGKCVSVCPTGNIVPAADKTPVWKHDGSCTCCLACYHHCATHAINYGKRTKKRGQYYFKETK